jgi:uncharacterized repeat protein (TIGR01451 family)
MITKSDNPDPVHVGTHLTYTLTATNHGPSTGHGVVIHDPLPAGTSFVSASATAGTCSGTTTVDCSIGDLANGASATVTVVVTPSTAGSLSNTAIVSGAGPDPDPSLGNDTLTGAAGKDKLHGGPGKDTESGGPGKDLVKGGGAADRAQGQRRQGQRPRRLRKGQDVRRRRERSPQGPRRR